MPNTKLVARPWKPQDLIDDLQGIIDEECDNYLNTRRTTLCMARDYLKEYFATDNNDGRKWISVKDRLPEEHDSIWAELYGTKSWQPGLFRKCSYDVLACVEKKDGNRRVISIRTYDGKWDHNKLNEETVICWQPLPQPPKGE